MNDPNGFSYVDGHYDLFYQHHGLSGDTSHLYWRLASSEDLVDFVDEGIMLSPKFPYEGVGADGGGCFSGSRWKKGNDDYLLYAAASSVSGQSVALAKFNGSFYAQIKGNPIALPPAFVDPFSFRDPYCFAYGGKDYFIIGASSKEKKAMLLIYELEGEKALYRGIFYEDASIEMFECPALLFLEGKAVLIISPIGLKSEGILHQNLTNNVALIGRLDENMCFERESPYLDLDSGFDYYAAQGISSPTSKDEAFLAAWLCLWNKDFSSIPTGSHDGYIGTMALPRSLTLKEGKLLQKPLPSLEKRFNAGKIEALSPGQRKEVSLSSRLKIEKPNGGFSISFFANSHGAVSLRYDPSKKEATIKIEDNRPEGLRFYSGGERTIGFENGLRTIDAYIDRYVLELCFNGGEKWATLMYYPHLLESEKAAIVVEGGNLSMREDDFETAPESSFSR